MEVPPHFTQKIFVRIKGALPSKNLNILYIQINIIYKEKPNESMCLKENTKEKQKCFLWSDKETSLTANAQENKKVFDEAMSLKENAIKIKMFLMKS